MIKLHPNKIINIVAMIFIFGMALIMFNVTDVLKPTRDELIKFYKTHLDSCTLTKLTKRKYPGRGDYTVFYTDCTSDNFPVLLEKNSNTENYELFKENIKLTKDSNSIELLLENNNGVHRLRIRKSEDEDDRGFGTQIVLIFMGISIVIIILLPNRLYEKKLD